MGEDRIVEHDIREQYRDDRDRLCTQITDALSQHPHVVDAWFEGSIGREHADDLSDLDLGVVVHDAAIGAIIVDPVAFVTAITPIILEIHAAALNPQGGVYLLTWVAGDALPIQVDWYLYPASSARRPLGTLPLLTSTATPLADPPTELIGAVRDAAIDAAIRDALLMLFMAGKRIARRDAWAAMQHLQHVDRSVGTIAWLHAHGRRPAFTDPVPSILPAEVPSTTAARVACLREIWHELIRQLDVCDDLMPYRSAMEAIHATFRLLDAIVTEEAS